MATTHRAGSSLKVAQTSSMHHFSFLPALGLAQIFFTKAILRGRLRRHDAVADGCRPPAHHHRNLQPDARETGSGRSARRIREPQGPREGHGREVQRSHRNCEGREQQRVHRPLQPPPLRTRRQLRDEPAHAPRRLQGTGTVRKEHEGVPEPRRSRSRQALQLREERERGIAGKL